MPRSVPARTLKEMFVWITSGFMPAARNSSRSKLRANQPRSSASRSGSITITPGSGVSTKRIALGEQRQLRRARREAPAPLADEVELLHDLVLEVPGQDHDHVGPVLADLPGRGDRDVAAGREVARLVRVQVACVVDEVRADPAVVEKCVPVRRSAVPDDAQLVGLQGDEEVEDLALVLRDPPAIAEIG